MGKLLIVGAALLVTACETIPLNWNRQGSSAQDLYGDRAACEAQAHMGDVRDFGSRSVRTQMFTDCMRGKGWTPAP